MFQGGPTRMVAVHIICVMFGISGVIGSICLKCDDVPLPNLCFEVTQCGPHESCLTEQYVTSFGTVSYKLGCSSKLACGGNDEEKRDNILTCTECCDGDLCNSKACGKSGFSDQFGPICYTCPLQLGSSTCNKISLCDKDQVCGIRHVTKVGAPDNLFATNCFSSNECNADTSGLLSTVEKMSCCNSTICNQHDPRRLTTTTQKMTTAKPVTTTSQPVTTTTVQQPNAVCEDVVGAVCPVSTSACQVQYSIDKCKKTCGLCSDTDSPTHTTKLPSSTLSISSTTTQPATLTHSLMTLISNSTPVATTPKTTTKATTTSTTTSVITNATTKPTKATTPYEIFPGILNPFGTRSSTQATTPYVFYPAISNPFGTRRSTQAPTPYEFLPAILNPFGTTRRGFQPGSLIG